MKYMPASRNSLGLVKHDFPIWTSVLTGILGFGSLSFSNLGLAATVHKRSISRRLATWERPRIRILSTRLNETVKSLQFQDGKIRHLSPTLSRHHN